MLRMLPALLVCTSLLVAGCGSDDKGNDKETTSSKDKAAMSKDDKAMSKDDDAMSKDDKVMSEVGEQTKAAHFVSSMPAHGAMVAASTKQVDLTFDFDLAEGTKAMVTMNGKDVTSGEAKIVRDNLGLTVPADLSTPGVYEVVYDACWPDGSCHDGRFAFTVKG